MKLVSYSDSEESDSEARSVDAARPSAANKKAFQTVASRKIRVELPAQSTADTSTDEPSAKRARTTGGFGGFNSLLPAPKRTVQPASGLGRNVHLKTSSEAAFSRRPLPEQSQETVSHETKSQEIGGSIGDGRSDADAVATNGTNDSENNPRNAVEEVKLVGNPTRFKPLSVASKKKGPKKPKSFPTESVEASTKTLTNIPVAPENVIHKSVAESKPKMSLFSMHEPGVDASDEQATGDYESFISSKVPAKENEVEREDRDVHGRPSAPNTLEAVAEDLNLTAAQRRQLFGRNGKNVPADINIANFDMDSEYASNEQLRRSGQAVEHRAVKTIAAGKHSLQQLVNNARNNQESMQDKWAEGRRNRGDGGSKYGWS